MLKEGASGYSLFFGKRFGMNVHAIPPQAWQDYHDRLMKRYGLIDKKREYRPNDHESSYMIMWHDADGVIILAREIYGTDPSRRSTAAQVIHMDKTVFDTIAGDLAKG